MNNHMKKYLPHGRPYRPPLLILIFLLSSIASWAQSPDGQDRLAAESRRTPGFIEYAWHLVVWQKDGSKVTFLLDEKPRVIHDGDKVLVKSSSTVEYDYQAIKKMTYEEEEVTGIREAVASEGLPFSTSGGTITFAAAAKAAFANMENETRAERELQAYFRERLLAAFGERSGDSPAPSGILWNGPVPGDDRLANNISVSFPGVSAESLLISLDLAGICASGGSACTTGALDPSHVIMAVSGDRKRAEGTIRFTTGPENTKEEIDRTIEVLGEALRRIRTM